MDIQYRHLVVYILKRKRLAATVPLGIPAGTPQVSAEARSSLRWRVGAAVIRAPLLGAQSAERRRQSCTGEPIRLISEPEFTCSFGRAVGRAPPSNLRLQASLAEFELHFFSSRVRTSLLEPKTVTIFDDFLCF